MDVHPPQNGAIGYAPIFFVRSLPLLTCSTVLKASLAERQQEAQARASAVSALETQNPTSPPRPSSSGMCEGETSGIPGIAPQVSYNLVLLRWHLCNPPRLIWEACIPVLEPSLVQCPCSNDFKIRFRWFWQSIGQGGIIHFSCSLHNNRTPASGSSVLQQHGNLSNPTHAVQT